MASQLYRPGNTHNVRGVECELGNFNAYELTDRINEGWYRTPGEWLKETKEEPAEQPEIAKSDPNHPVRQAAKEADIDGWGSKRISTLEKELDGPKE